MAKYSVMHSCGHEEIVNLVGKYSSREWRITRMEQEECFECYKQHQTQFAQQEAQEQELPLLVGTEKQIAYAMTVRQQMLSVLDTYLSTLDTLSPLVIHAVETITHQTSAHQWIEWRTIPVSSLLDRLCKEQVKQIERDSEAYQQQERMKQVALQEATLRPEHPVTETVAEIGMLANGVEVLFSEKREDFRELMRFRLRYEWTGDRWRRLLKPRNGTPENRAIECAHTLLAHGFCIRLFDAFLRQKAIAGDFEPEHTRWITKRLSGPYTGWFALEWSRRDDLYDAARRLKGSRYERPCVLVPSEQIEEIVGFAEVYDFRLSRLAQEYVEELRAFRRGIVTVAVTPHEEQQKGQVSTTVPPVLAIPEQVEVLEAFREDDD